MNSVPARAIRSVLRGLPEATSHGDRPTLAHVYVPRSHLRALSPDRSVVTGMRGAGKTFWWRALQDKGVRELVAGVDSRSAVTEATEIRPGFGVTPAVDSYPGKDVLRSLMGEGHEPRMIWRTVQAWSLAQRGHEIRSRGSWRERVAHVSAQPEAIDRLFEEADRRFEERRVYCLVLFDALDRCADDWKDMYRLIRGLLQLALEMRSFRRLRVKMFLRSDQLDEGAVGGFPDASKVLASAVDLSWPRRELYGLLWHHLVNHESEGGAFRKALAGSDRDTAVVGGSKVFLVPRKSVANEEEQRARFHGIAGPWMGRDRRRGFPYTWIPNHLGDTEGRVSPRSFLETLRTAAQDTADRHPSHRYALHHESIRKGVQEASRIRVGELREDYPWVDRVLEPLRGMVVPCRFGEMTRRWKARGVLEGLARDMEEASVKLPPRTIERGARGVREDLETLGVFLRLQDGRVNMPDVFRVGYGLGRRGGVKPIR